MQLRPKTSTGAVGISLGGADAAGTLGLTDAELDRVTAASLTIGDETSGALAVVAPIGRPSATNTSLKSGVRVHFNGGTINTAGGTLAISSLVRPFTSGVDATASSLSFAAGAILEMDIGGLTVDSQYQQLNVNGSIDLTSGSCNSQALPRRSPRVSPLSSSTMTAAIRLPAPSSDIRKEQSFPTSSPVDSRPRFPTLGAVATTTS